MRIGLDIDGVIRPWHISMYRYFQIHKNFQGTEEQFWEYFIDLPSSSQEYYVSIPILYMDTIPTKDVLEFVPKLSELGEVYYITACPPDVAWATEKFFDIYEMPFKENIVYSKDKATIIRAKRIDIFLDDLPHNVESVQNLTDAYLFKCIHNRKDREKFRVISSIQEFYELIRSKNDK